MNDLTPQFPRTHNNPPSPIEAVQSAHDDVLSEAQNWADGKPVETEAQMLAVDAVLKGVKTYRTALVAAGKEITAPLHKAHSEAVAAVKVHTDDADRLQAALVAVVSPIKKRLADEKAEADRLAQQAAWEASRKAREAIERANVANIDEQRAAAAAQAEAEIAQAKANAARKDTVKGMRTVVSYAVTDHKALLHWIALNRRDDLTAFVDEWARKNHKDNRNADGLTVTESKEAY
jgi:hypothetical protein